MSGNQPSNINRPPALRPKARGNLIWSMVALAFVVHAALLLLLSPKLFSSDTQSPERLFEKGESELAQGHYPEALALFQKVMDLQPKVPPVFEKAAEQHKMAERLARQYTPKAPATREAAPDPVANPTPATQATARPPVPTPKAPSTRPANSFIPPELQGK